MSLQRWCSACSFCPPKRTKNSQPLLHKFSLDRQNSSKRCPVCVTGLTGNHLSPYDEIIRNVLLNSGVSSALKYVQMCTNQGCIIFLVGFRCRQNVRLEVTSKKSIMQNCTLLCFHLHQFAILFILLKHKSSLAEVSARWSRKQETKTFLVMEGHECMTLFCCGQNSIGRLINTKNKTPSKIGHKKKKKTVAGL